MTKFLRIETRGENLVAVFDSGVPETMYAYDARNNPYPITTDGTFRLSENDLRARIANRERSGRDVSVEREALRVMMEMQSASGVREVREGQ